MTAHLTPAQAAKLGIDVPHTHKRSTRKEAPAAETTDTRCVACSEVFSRKADEDRHFKANPTHARYEAVL